MFGWLKRGLGISALQDRVLHLEKLEHFTLNDVVNRLSDAYIILGADDQVLAANEIIVPSDKNGIIMLKERAIIRECVVRPEKVRKTTTTHSLEKGEE